jgi:leader peptidase (prepilin peptidase)/N-methyltransferase
LSLDLILIFLVGASFGSFGNVLISRVPKSKSILTQSACPKCETNIKIWHNIPILSWFILQGKCKYCGEKISFQYPLIETVTAFLYLILYIKLGWTIEFFIITLMFMLLIVLSVIDFYHYAVPDSINLLILTLAIIHTFDINILENLLNAMLFAGGFSLLRYYVSFAIQKEAMGEGDIIVAGAIGAILGGYMGLVAIFLSAILSLPASILARFGGKAEIPFVPFLALAMFIVYIFESEIIKILNFIILR